MASEDWFESRKPAAVQKHGIIARYAPYFAVRAGTPTRGRVAFVDGYAGEGRYDDASPGSPLLLVEEADRAKVFDRNVELAFVESDKGRADRLHDVLRDTGVNDPVIHNCQFAQALPEIEEAFSDRATLYFLDPFSYGLPFDQLVLLLQSSSLRRPVDVIYHFSASTIARCASRVVKARDHDQLGEMEADLDAALGPIDWRAAFERIAAETTTGLAYSLAAELSRAVAEAAAEQSGVRATVVEIKPKPGAATIYTLALFSRDRQAHWDYLDQAGSAYVDWLLRCSQDEFQANLPRPEELQLFALDECEPERADVDNRVKDEAVRYLTSHIPELLARHDGSLTFLDYPELVYGDQLGRARVTHVRAAVKQLHTNGVVDDDGKGKLFFKRPISLVRR